MRFSKRTLLKIGLITAVIAIFCLCLRAKFENSSEATIATNATENSKNSSDRYSTSGHVPNLFLDAVDDFEDLFYANAPVKSSKRRNVSWSTHHIEIWGKAAIGDYLWYHILQGSSVSYAKGIIRYGELILQNIHLHFRAGPGVTQFTAPNTVQNLILVLNGRAPDKIHTARLWLNHLRQFKHLKKVALLLLGNERCENNWILNYLRMNGGLIDLVFLVYDSPLIDNKVFFQWPLGVASYRGFPHFTSDAIKVDAPRRFLCNFVGTAHKNTSRILLRRILNKSGKCYTNIRDIWPAKETYHTVDKYLKTLTASDLTLSPVGSNTECYRIYESMALGSVPVVENVLTPGVCDSSSANSPLRLLKEFNAPMILVNNWNELGSLLEVEGKLSLHDKIERRKRVLKWYENFKMKMKNRLLRVVRENFFREV